MKKVLITALISGLCYTLCSAQITEKERPQQESETSIKKSYLTKTAWDQGGIYTKYSPGQAVLGCWSTAMAQILYYHHLMPHGTINYTCTQGYLVRDTLENHPLSWDDFALKINKGSDPKNVDAVTLYTYLTAEAVRKDFGTGKYLEMVNPAPQIEKHYDCKATFYVSFTGQTPFSKQQLDGIAQSEHIEHLIGPDSIRLIIKKEIGAKRPVYFHMSNFTTYGHSTVIDAYEERDGIFYVHINYGSSGFRTGWYDLFKPIDVADDIKLRAFVTIVPKR